jgi:serine O-acetyltransferase
MNQDVPEDTPNEAAAPHLLRDLRADMEIILRYLNRPVSPSSVLWACFGCDAFIILAMYRTRQWCRRWHIPLVNRVVRLMETAMFSIELGNDIELGHGVYFMHSLGTVVGGNSKIGEGVIFLGNNTIGASTSKGCPRIGKGTVIGAGARVLGEIDIGERCMVGANAVVVRSIPAGKMAVGIPAAVVGDYNPGSPATNGA